MDASRAGANIQGFLVVVVGGVLVEISGRFFLTLLFAFSQLVTVRDSNISLYGTGGGGL